MRYNYVFEDINQALPIVMTSLVADGQEFGSRAGLTKELMHVGITLTNPQRREIVLESRKANIAAQIVETMWVLAGRNDVETLLPYLPRAIDFSDDGQVWRSGYGPRLRDFNGVDQLAYVVETLKSKPSSRQAVINLWDPVVDTTPGKDVACNNWLSFSSRHGILDLHVGIRSNDAMWGWSGINAFEWSVLLEVVAGLAGLKIGSLHFSTTSFHLYETHWVKAAHIANDRTPWMGYPRSPAFGGTRGWDLLDLDISLKEWFALEERIRTGQPALVDRFPEPMMRSWLQVLQWYWSGHEGYLDDLQGTRLRRACLVGTKPVGVPQEPKIRVESIRDELPFDERFLAAVNALHTEKHAAYGDSWKRRGESGILGNIARKVDRIGSGLDTSDETQADTAVDLLVYLAKYRCWLEGADAGPVEVELVLGAVPPFGGPTYFAEDFTLLEEAVTRDPEIRIDIVDRMLAQSMTMAKTLWKG